MSSATFLRRLRRAPAPTARRVQVHPPAVLDALASPWAQAWAWLAGREGTLAPPRRTPLEQARGEFVAALQGLVHLESGDLLCRAQHARSLRELWHLRSELYTLIARRLSQPEADTRLARVNQHFPRRAPRAGIHPTEVLDVR